MEAARIFLHLRGQLDQKKKKKGHLNYNSQVEDLECSPGFFRSNMPPSLMIPDLWMD